MSEFTPDEGMDIVFLPEQEQGVPFYDEIPKRPLEMDFNGEKVTFTPDNCYVVIYRKAPEFSYAHWSDGDAELYFWNMTELVGWLSGFKWDEFAPERSRNRERDSMNDICGWEASTMVTDWPSPEIKNLYEMSQMTDLYKMAGELTVDDIITTE